MANWIVLILLMYTFVASDVLASVNKTTSKCFAAHGSINSSIISQYCIPYQLPLIGYCRNIIKWNVNDDKSNQQQKEDVLERFRLLKVLLQTVYKLKFKKSCSITIDEVFCRRSFPRCDISTSTLLSQPVCKESCENVINICSEEIEAAKKAKEIIREIKYPIRWDVLKCDDLPKRNGGDAPECYYTRHLNTETDKLESKECYYGNGLGYRGNVTETISGRVCQSWSSQCPHRHRHPLAEYPELVNASNYCRNSGGQAPNGPWCYTTDKNRRWEYCNVKKCPDPGPSLPPIIQTAFSTGPNKIYIEWRPVPLPFVHGTPKGFRIQTDRHRIDNMMLNITNSNVTQYEVENLLPLTVYNISILEYNEHDEGPWSRTVTVTTKPQYSVAVMIEVILKNKKFSRALLIRNKPRYRRLEKQVKSKLKKLLQKTKGYNIFDIHVVRFFQGSVGVDLLITAELMNVTSWSVTQSIVGRIVEGEKSRQSKGLAFSSLHAKVSPPPPKNLTQSDVTHTSVTLHWSAPDYSGPFNILNYTIQYKKSGTSMKYYDAVVVSGDTHKTSVANLDDGTKYLMRVLSVNAYGIEPSEPIAVATRTAMSSSKTTRTTPTAAIAAPIAVMATVLVVVGVVFWRWWIKKQQNEKELKQKIQRLRKNPYDLSVDWFKLLKISVVKPWWEIPRDQLTLEHQVGGGTFGVVSKGFVKKKDENGREIGLHCAVKMLKENPTERQLLEFCKEIKTMSSIDDHANIVSLIGACTIDGPPLLVVKFAPNGCLLDYIVENRPLPDYENTVNIPLRKIINEKERLKFAYEIAQGMAHLEKCRFVHRDLATRNILLGKNMIAMVSDFGLSRDIYEMGVYEQTDGGILPVRWMSPESLKYFTYNSKTDVWSYGVLLWEMESGGNVPYGGLQGQEILEHLKQGYRLHKPRDTSPDIYSLMWKCWNPDPKQRPTFSDLVYQVGGMYALAGGNENVATSSGALMNQAFEHDQPQRKHNDEETLG